MGERHPLMPADTPDYMADAWAACMQWAIGEPEILAAFRQETGNLWEPGRTGLDRVIDRATGVDRTFIEAFIVWANENV